MSGLPCRTCNEFIDFLESISWFRLMSAENKQRCLQAVQATFVEYPNDEPVPTDSYAVLHQFPVVFDAETISGEGDFTRLIKDLEENSFGVFKPDQIFESWESSDDDGYLIRLSIKMNGKKYRKIWQWSEYDFVDAEVFELLDEVLQDCNPPLAQLVENGGNECIYLVNDAKAIQALLDNLPLAGRGNIEFFGRSPGSFAPVKRRSLLCSNPLKPPTIPAIRQWNWLSFSGCNPFWITRSSRLQSSVQLHACRASWFMGFKFPETPIHLRHGNTHAAWSD